MNNYYWCQRCNFCFDGVFDKSYHCFCNISNYSYYFDEIKVLSLRLESELFLRIRLDFKNNTSTLYPSMSYNDSKDIILQLIITPQYLENIDNIIKYL